MGNAVANKKSAELSTDILDDIFETAGEGASFSSDEMAIPFVRLLQPMSPQINKKKPRRASHSALIHLAVQSDPAEKTASLSNVLHQQGKVLVGNVSHVLATNATVFTF